MVPTKTRLPFRMRTWVDPAQRRQLHTFKVTAVALAVMFLAVCLFAGTVAADNVTVDTDQIINMSNVLIALMVGLIPLLVILAVWKGMKKDVT